MNIYSFFVICGLALCGILLLKAIISIIKFYSFNVIKKDKKYACVNWERFIKSDCIQIVLIKIKNSQILSNLRIKKICNNKQIKIFNLIKLKIKFLTKV